LLDGFEESDRAAIRFCTVRFDPLVLATIPPAFREPAATAAVLADFFLVMVF